MRRRFMRRAARQLRRETFGGIPPMLIRSNELLAHGDFGAAAEGLEELARGAEARGGRFAPRLYIEAGNARIRAGQRNAGVELIRHGLDMFAAAGLTHRRERVGWRLAQDLDATGHSEEAGQVRAILGDLSAAATLPASASDRAKHSTLPTHCPGCGAPLRPDDVEWLDDATAECEYCGTPVRGE